MTKQNTNSRHERTFAIEWGDMDALGHVNNGRYFDYFQQSRIEWLAGLNAHLTEKEGPVLIQAECTFLKPIVYPATITVTTLAKSPGRTSFVVAHQVLQNEELMAKGNCKVVWVDYLKNKSIPIPDWLRQQLPS